MREEKSCILGIIECFQSIIFFKYDADKSKNMLSLLELRFCLLKNLKRSFAN